MSQNESCVKETLILSNRKPTSFCMKNQKLTYFSFLIATVFLLSACSSVKITKIEKRRYQNGYYVQMNKGKPEFSSVKARIEQKEKKEEFASTEIESKADKQLVRRELKKLKEAVKEFKKEENLKEFIASVDDLMLVDTKKNQASVPKRQLRTDGILSPDETQGGVVAVLLLLIGISFLIIFLVAGWALIIMIAAAVIIGIVLSVILKAVGLIGK